MVSLIRHVGLFNVKKFNLKLYYQNTRGLRTKTGVFFKNLSICNFDIVVLTETWLSSKVMSSELFDDRYVVFRRDRKSKANNRVEVGGGVLIAVSKKIQAKEITCWNSSCEDLWVIVDYVIAGKVKQIAFCVVYLPPPVRNDLLDSFVDHCSSILEKFHGHICIIGDFNLRNINWTRLDTDDNYQAPVLCQKLIDFASLNNLKQYNKVANFQNTLLDLLFTDLTNCKVFESLDVLSKVDNYHPPLYIDIYLGDVCNLEYNPNHTKLSFHGADYSAINDYFSNIIWEEQFSQYTDINQMVTHFYIMIREVISKYVPQKKNYNYKKFPPWFSKSLIKRIREKKNILNRYKKYNNPLDRIELDTLSRRCARLNTTCYNAYMTAIEDKISKNIKAFWSYANSKRNGRSLYPVTMTNGDITVSDGPSICSLFANRFAKVYSNLPQPNSSYSRSINASSLVFSGVFISVEEVEGVLKSLNTEKGAGPDGIPSIFLKKCASSIAMPLCIMYNASLASGTFPDEWKIAKVVPVFKSGDNDLVDNYRPISVLSTMSKVFEILICQFVYEHVKPFITVHQHGFVKSRSTATNLVSFVENLTEAIDGHQEIDVVYTDLCKAFDKVSHEILIKKLSAFGIQGTLLNWFKSYLNNREFFVVVNGFQSEKCKIESGVPQGSNLGPVLFNIFINDIVDYISHSTPYLYADDLKLLKIIKTKQDPLLLQKDLNSVSHWCDLNGMQLNVAKCFHVKFTRRHNNIDSAYYLNGAKIQEVDHINDLGVIIDKKLTFGAHLENIIKKASNMLGFIIRISKGFRKLQTRRLLYNSLVLSILEYCSVVWRPHYACHSLRLERIQKRYLWHLSYLTNTYKKGYSHRNRQIHFKYPSLENRRIILDLTFLYKLFNNKLDCPDLLNKFKFNVPRRLPRLALPPLVPPFRTTVLGSSSFVPRASRLLNSYGKSTDIHAVNLNTFRKNLHENLGLI
jgi:hypothetical protein